MAEYGESRILIELTRCRIQRAPGLPTGSGRDERFVKLSSKLYPVAFPPANRMGVAKCLSQGDFRSGSRLASQLLPLSASSLFSIDQLDTED